MKISEQMKGGKGFGNATTPGTATPEGGGGDMALALTSSVQGQANQMALAAQAANLSIEHASEQMADYFAGVMSGQALLNATLAKTQQRLQDMGGPVRIETEVQPITMDLPSPVDFGSTRQRFLGLFGGGDHKALPNPFAKSPAADEVAGDA